MATNQEVIDNLIDYIDKAILKNSVSNRQVAAVLAFLNESLKQLPTLDLDSLSNYFLRKDIPNSAAELITFIKGLKSLSPIEVGEVIDSMLAGRGTLITPDKIQTPRLEVRGQAVFMEMIINRLSAMEGDTSFSESGTIDEVEPIDATTYRLKMRKRWDNDFTAFDVDDVVYGIVNRLSASGEYYTVWFRVLQRDLSANTLLVSLYPGTEVPGGVNYAPIAGINVARRGNAIDEDRQSCWYVSTTEGAIMYLTGVTKPVLEDYNYSLILGRPKNLALFNGLPINYKHPYIYARGAIIQDLLRIDYQGKPVIAITDRGLWSITEATNNPYLFETLNPSTGNHETHDVWHKSCRYRCLRSGTTQEPRWNATDWSEISGDATLSAKISSSNGTEFGGPVDTVLTLYIYRGVNDISDDVLDADIEWTRTTRDSVDDNRWAMAHADTGKVLHLSDADMGSFFETDGECIFTVTAYVRDNDGNVDNYATKSFTINP